METGSSLAKPMHQLLNCRVEQCLCGSAIVTKRRNFYYFTSKRKTLSETIFTFQIFLKLQRCIKASKCGLDCWLVGVFLCLPRKFTGSFVNRRIQDTGNGIGHKRSNIIFACNSSIPPGVALNDM